MLIVAKTRRMKMAQVKVDVSDKLIDEATKKEIKSLRGQVTRLRNKNEKLEREIHEGKELVNKAWAIVNAVKDAGDFRTDDDDY